MPHIGAGQQNRWTKRLLSFMRLHPFIAGVEISDFAVRIAYFNKGAWRFEGLRLAPGICEDGRIKDFQAFVLALQSLKSRAFPRRFLKRKLNVIVSLSSSNLYSQTFSVPMLTGDPLLRAIRLNLQMVSPVEFSQAYSGWQKIGENAASSRLEFLGAFIDRTIVDDMTRALFKAGFLAVAVEPKALALARLMREQGLDIDSARSYVFLDVDGVGVDFLIIRGGELYFEYFTAWKDIADEKGHISASAVETTVLRNLHQIFNFYGQHWREIPTEVIVSSTAMLGEIEKVIHDNFDIHLRELVLRAGEGIGSEWFVSLGSGLRAEKPRAKDTELSLLGIEAEREFRREQMIGFLEFWRVLLPSAFGVMLAVFIMTDLFLAQSRGNLEQPRPLAGQGTSELENMKRQATDFNRVVQLVKGAESLLLPKHWIMEKLGVLAAAHATTLRRFDFKESSMPFSLAGTASSQADLAAFRQALEEDPMFKDIQVPLKDIAVGPSGVEFTLTLTIVSPNADP